MIIYLVVLFYSVMGPMKFFYNTPEEACSAALTFKGEYSLHEINLQKKQIKEFRCNKVKFVLREVQP